MASSEETFKKCLEKTTFTEKELKDFFSYGDGDKIKKEKFCEVLGKSGFTSAKLQERLWDVADIDDDNNVNMEEFILHLDTLLHGTLKQISSFFFEMFDIDHDQTLSREEIVEVYGELLKCTKSNEMNAEIESRIKKFVEEADVNKDGKLDFEEFFAAIEKSAEAKKEKRTPKSVLLFAYLILLLSFFEMGTSFSLPAMGALSSSIRLHLDINETQIGTLTGIYFVAAIVGPLIGGFYLTKVGPLPVLLVANGVVFIGSILQAFTATSWGNNFILLILARLVIGFGGEVTAFASIEIVALIWPKNFITMAGIRNLIQSSSVALAFVILPAIAGEPDVLNFDNGKLLLAMWVIVILAGCSILSSVLIYIYLKKKLDSADQLAPAAMFKAFATKITPKMPGKFSDFKLPASFYASMFSIQAFYFPPFAFTAFSIQFFVTRFGVTQASAGVASGLIALVAGFLGVGFAPLSDWTGRRSLMMALFTVPALLAHILLIWGSATFFMWFSVLLLAITYGFGDTVGICSIRFLVGEKRSGIGYGIFGVFGNLIGFLVPLIGGVIIDSEDGEGTYFNVFFSVLMLLAILPWFLVRYLEGPKSRIELPASKLHEIEDSDLNRASLFTIIGTDNKKKDKGDKKKKGEEMKEVKKAEDETKKGEEEVPSV